MTQTLPPRPHPSNDPTCVQVASGTYFNPFNFTKRDVSLPDIVSSLSKICRYNGHCEKFYSVAQHSVHVAERVWERHGAKGAMVALFHDAAEAYIGDMVRPLRNHKAFQLFNDLDDQVSLTIYERLGIPAADVQLFWPATMEADIELLSCEAAKFMRGGGREWNWGEARPNFSRLIVPLSPSGAAALFWGYYGELKEELEFAKENEL